MSVITVWIRIKTSLSVIIAYEPTVDQMMRRIRLACQSKW